LGGPRHSLFLVKKENVQVTLVMELPAAKLSQADDDKPRRLSFHRAGARRWNAILFHEPGIFELSHMSETCFGHFGERLLRAIDAFAPEKIADADSQMLGVLEIVDGRQRVRGAAAQFSQRRVQLAARRELVELQ